MRLRTLRLVSFDRRHLAAMQYELIAEEAATEIVISSELVNRQPLPGNSSDPRLAADFDGRVLVPVGTRREGLRAILSYITPGSGLILGCGMDHLLESPFRNQGGMYDVGGWLVGEHVIPGGCSKPVWRPHVEPDQPPAA